MKAVIMAGGEGTRLRPLTCNIPKPMVPIMNKPVMEHIINLLKNFGIKDIAVTLFYLPEVIKNYFGDGESYGVNLTYSIENMPLGTGGSVLNTGDFIDGTFIVISGDSLTDIDLDEALRFHKSKNSMATLIIKKEPIPLEYGVVITDSNGRIIRFLEKPSWGEVFSDTINTGIYILEPSVFHYYSRGENFDFSKDLFPRLLKDNIPMYGYVTSEYWCDIGDLESYKSTHYDILQGKVNLYGYKDFDLTSINIGANSVVSAKSIIHSPVFIGSNCIIKDHAVLDPFTVVGDNCIISENTSLKKSILWHNISLGLNNQCRSTIIGSRVTAKDNVNFFENTVIGENNTILDNAFIKPGVKIWPGKRIPEGAYVNSSLVWGTKSLRNIFGNRGISGEINFDINPEFMSLLGAAFASSLKKGSCITVSCDDSPSSFIVKQSITSGILSTGSQVVDIENLTLPMSRYAVRLYSAAGGIHIYRTSKSQDIVYLEFFNEYGGTIDRKTERKIENIFLREDFERCTAEALSKPVAINNFHTQYIHQYLKHIHSIQLIKNKSLSILVSSTSEMTQKYASQFLGSVGCIVKTVKNEHDFDTFKSFTDYFSSLVASGEAFLGAIISDNGENIILVDKMGNVIDRDSYVIFSALLSLKYEHEPEIIIPGTASMAVESIAGKFQARVIRSKSSIAETVNSILNIYKNENSSMLQYVLSFDGIAALVKIIDILVQNSLNLHDLSNEIPEFHLKKTEFTCDFKEMGRIIRTLADSYQDAADLHEGIRINEGNGWTLILPDNERPVLNIYTEGFSSEYADEIALQIEEKLKSIFKS